MSTTIRCNDDYYTLLDKIQGRGFDVNGTFELVGEQLTIPLMTSEQVAEMFNILPQFRDRFIEDLYKFEDESLGPYRTKYYFFMIPALMIAMKSFKEDCNDTRRCVIKFPVNHCFQSIQFLIRDNTVNIVCNMRSCNAIANLPTDIWICAFLGDSLSRKFNDMYEGSLYSSYKIIMNIGSLHVFKADVRRGM